MFSPFIESLTILTQHSIDLCVCVKLVPAVDKSDSNKTSSMERLAIMDQEFDQ